MKKNMDPSGNSFFRSDAGGIFDLIFYDVYMYFIYKVVSAKKKRCACEIEKWSVNVK